MFFSTIIRTKSGNLEGRIINTKTVEETVKQWWKFYNKPNNFEVIVDEVVDWINEQLVEKEFLTRKEVLGVMSNRFSLFEKVTNNVYVFIWSK